MKHNESNYTALNGISRQIKILDGISQLLQWDQETYMPSEASGIRAEQLELLAGLTHKEKTSKQFGTLLGKLIDIDSGHLIATDLSPPQEAAVRLWRKDYRKTILLPTEFVEEFTKISSQSMQVWQSAKKDNCFHVFAPFLDKIVSMNRQKAEYLGYEEHPYDALLDDYEPDAKTKEIESLFEKLRSTLTPLIKKMASKNIQNDFLFGEWDHSKQLAFGKIILEKMGYDFSKGRIDFSAHPFSSSAHPTDSRITTRIHPSSLMSNISVLMHEGGHSLYEMGLPQEFYGNPLGDAQSYGIHESQSRWWETRIGLSEPFWHYFFPLLKETFHGQLDHISFDTFYQGINKITPSFIRVEADELTYPIHIILRFEIEKGLIEGTIQVRDIPELWNAKMENYLGITPPTNREGCLQDVHWSMGAFGYFPTYTLGNLYAAHLFEGFEKEHPEWKKNVASGELGFIKGWLHEKIHQHGRRYSTEQLLKNATGRSLTAEPYLKYLSEKYTF